MTRWGDMSVPQARQASTYNNVNVLTNPSADPFAGLAYGDTSVSTSATTAVAITNYSLLQGVQVEYINGVPDIGYMQPTGARMEYKLNVSAAGTYTLNFDVAAITAGSFDVLVNGVYASTYNYSTTGDWQRYATASQSMVLGTGNNTVAIVPKNGAAFNLKTFSLTPNGVSNDSSNNGTGLTVGSGGATIAADQQSAMNNCQIEYVTGKPDVGFMGWGGYVEYTLNVQSAGNYNIAVDTASPWNGSYTMSVNGAAAATCNYNATDSWGNFQPVSNTVYLAAGTNVIRLATANGSQYNTGNITISPIGNANNNNNGTGITVGSGGATIAADQQSAMNNCQIEYLTGKPDVGFMSWGGYVEYTLNVQSAGNYNIAVDTASPWNGSYTMSVNGAAAATCNYNATNSWAIFQPVSNTVYLAAGTNVIRLATANGSQYNTGNITISPAGNANNTPPESNPSPPNYNGGAITVSTQWMTSFTQLNIVGTSANDSIYVSQSGNTITVTANGTTSSYTGPYGAIAIKSGGGNDTITVDSSVTLNTAVYGGSGNCTITNRTQGLATVVTVGGGINTVQGNGFNSAFWVNGSDTVNASSAEIAAGDVHRVTSFWGGVSTSLLGQDLPDPIGTGSVTRLTNNSLWGMGPTMADVNQGQLSDCYLLGPLQALAFSNPQLLQQMAVDLGDGTYAVQFKRGGTTTYVRVDGDLPAAGYYANGLMYAHPGDSGNIWAAIIEKAYAEFQTSAWNYSSLNYGYYGNVFSDLGIGYSVFGATDINTLFNTIANGLSAGKAVVIGTNANIVAGAPLIGTHTYSVTSAWRDGSGTGWVTLRNPWGFDGAGNDGNLYDGLVTMTISQLQANLQSGNITA